MTIEYRTFDWPVGIQISKQLFHVPGASLEGGLTAGGARILLPEPGGRSVLEVQPSLQTKEWSLPFASWISSKVNGEILRVRLARTPQVLTSRSINGIAGLSNYAMPGDTGDIVINDLTAKFAAAALEGVQEVMIDMSKIGNILRIGHVFGHGNYCYLVDDISYDTANIATVLFRPPLRMDIAEDDTCLFRPYFLGYISNGQEVRVTYDAENAGHIQPGKIVLNEIVL